jgi:transposase
LVLAEPSAYHANAALESAADLDMRAYIPEPKQKNERVWTDKPDEVDRAVYNNRRRIVRAKGKVLGRLRGERVERSFAHVCDTGGSRRSWIRKLEEVTKRYRIAAAAHNLARIMRLLFGIGKPRVQQAPANPVWLVQLARLALWRLLEAVMRRWRVVVGRRFAPAPRRPPAADRGRRRHAVWTDLPADAGKRSHRRCLGAVAARSV